MEIAHVYLAGSSAATDILNQVSNLMEGFESQYGLKTLTIAHWVTQDDPQVAASFEKTIAKVQDWSLRQRELIKPQHVKHGSDSMSNVGHLPLSQLEC